MGRTETSRCCWLLRLALGVLFLVAIQGVQSEHEPTESECRPYIEKALKDHHVEADELIDASSLEQEENPSIDEAAESNEEPPSGEEVSNDSNATPDSNDDNDDGEQENKTDEQNDDDQSQNDTESVEGDTKEDQAESQEESARDEAESASQEGDTAEDLESQEEGEVTGSQEEAEEDSVTNSQESDTVQDVQAESQEGDTAEDTQEGDTAEDTKDGDTTEDTQEGDTAEDTKEGDTAEDTQEGDTAEDTKEGDTTEDTQEGDTAEDTKEGDTAEDTKEGDTVEDTPSDSQEGNTGEDTQADSPEVDTVEDTTEVASDTAEETGSQEGETQEDSATEDANSQGNTEEADTAEVVEEETTEEPEAEVSKETVEQVASEEDQTASQQGTQESEETGEVSKETVEDAATAEDTTESQSGTDEGSDETEQQEKAVEDLTMEALIPENLRSRDHITQILKLDEDSVVTETALTKTIDTTLKTLKNLYDNAIKPLEILYKYRDLSNRHFGDPEIFSKPLVLFMGPWSGGKSSTINYLLDLEYKEHALRTGAEPSPAYFNILTYGEETEVLDGTQLAADWTFSGLQKFGQGMLDRLRGVKLPNRLLEKVNIVEIPGILEIRKQVQRLFPFNDACQWFIDRADIIFLVYDPAKLDVGPETEAILDQLKGREYQTRIILNKADTVKPEELMRVQGTLIWNISPLMSSQEPPVMYTTSLWSLPYEPTSPSRLLIAQERAFLRDLRDAIDRRIENKIASARRFAVRVRNHAKMVDCYLTTYYNHKTFFGNRKKTSDDIIENPTKYHIYEGLSTLTNISRYDLPDPDMYRDFFRINPLYDFTKLSDTCTYFRGCPINKLDIAIAYDLPELVGKYRKAVEAAKAAEAAKAHS